MNSQRPLRIYNSLTRKKEPFAPRNGANLVTWYNCGPTVYDHSHMGHARSYITFDIIRRILADYFGFEVLFVQNVTDIDDKIIRRARQQYLFDQYMEQIRKGDKSMYQVRSDVEKQILVLKEKLGVEDNIDKKIVLEKVLRSAESILVANDVIDLKDFAEKSRDILVDFLDNGQTLDFPNEIFSSLPRFFEDDYNQDMESLSILPPNVITRVSEYVPEIIDYIKVIISNGYAYESFGSVYFDVKEFASSPKHKYAKLVHEAVGDPSALADGEGDLFCSSTAASDKRSPADFVLWKKSKPGEPKWSSPWGEGRPGWHIECSVMASVILGEEIDIHSGGCDLRFPHHDNEMAQSEAYYDTGKEWINFFIHSGHLNINGQKMSKSLKNFTTIKEALKTHTHRQLRFAFLLHNWKDTLNYSHDTMADAISYEKYVSEFFLNITDVTRDPDRRFRKWEPSELELNRKLLKCQEQVDEALRDNFDTKASLSALKDIIKSCNNYLSASKSPHHHLLRDVSAYVSRILTIFGIIDKGYGIKGNIEVPSGDDGILMSVLQTLANFRLQMRNEAILLKNKVILDACDRLRDDDLIELGVRLEDREDSKTIVKLVDRESLIKEREEKKKVEETKLRLKEEKRKELEEREALNKMSPSEWSKIAFPSEKYAEFDEKGIPTHDADGKELSKAQRKKHIKDYETQDRRYQKYLAGSGKTSL